MSEFGVSRLRTFRADAKACSLHRQRNAAMNIKEKWQALLRCPREMWLMLLFKLLTSYGYFAVSAVLVLYLSAEHGYSDRGAATLYGVWGFAISGVGVFTGPLIDKLGIRKSVVLGALVSCVGMFGLAFAFTRSTMLIALLGVIPFGVSLALAVLDVGGKRYSYAGNTTLVFSLLYSAMNVGASIAGISLDILRSALGSSTGGRFNSHGFSASAERLLIMSAACTTCFAGLLAALTIREVDVSREGSVRPRLDLVAASTFEDDEFDVEEGTPPAQKPLWRRVLSAPVDLLRWYYNTALKSRLFWQVVAFTTALMFVRQVFRQMDATLPKWTLRVLGPDAPIGRLYSINPTLIVLLTPLSSMLVDRWDIYNVIMAGSLVSALSVFMLAGKVTLLAEIVALCAFTVGEAIYSAQATTFIMTLAPDGREGTYAQISNALVFMSKVPVGLLSGELMERYCPAPVGDSYEKERRCSKVWLVIAFVALGTPILLLLLKRFIYSADVQHYISTQTHQVKSGTIVYSDNDADDDADFTVVDDNDSAPMSPQKVKQSKD